MSETDSSERLTSIEMKLAYMEDFVGRLQDVVVEHTNTIEILKNENHALKDKLKELLDSAEGDIPNVRPPHY